MPRKIAAERPLSITPRSLQKKRSLSRRRFLEAAGGVAAAAVMAPFVVAGSAKGAKKSVK